jgi:hypothetical protein
MNSITNYTFIVAQFFDKSNTKNKTAGLTCYTFKLNILHGLNKRATKTPALTLEAWEDG